MSDKIENALGVIADGYGISRESLQAAILYASGYGDDSRLIQMGAVQPFDAVPTPHDTVRKLVEEAAEVFSAWYVLDMTYKDDEAYRAAYNDLTDEIADVIQVIANLCNALGIHDARSIIKACRDRNIKRGRIRPTQR